MICIVPSVYPTLLQAQHKNIGLILYIGNKYSLVWWVINVEFLQASIESSFFTWRHGRRLFCCAVSLQPSYFPDITSAWQMSSDLLSIKELDITLLLRGTGSDLCDVWCPWQISWKLETVYLPHVSSTFCTFCTSVPFLLHSTFGHFQQLS